MVTAVPSGRNKVVMFETRGSIRGIDRRKTKFGPCTPNRTKGCATHKKFDRPEIKRHCYNYINWGGVLITFRLSIACVPQLKNVIRLISRPARMRRNAAKLFDWMSQDLA